ncbi:MAG: glutathionylspermidine synthase family protein [Ignavibacteriae bacterium]|nr:glutathionylspermidine synthase family protein [Ignavibacteriota bacterium]MCB9216446.1 glutathionylspermidine synthase family protein [Ignavibacteria bacterium]
MHQTSKTTPAKVKNQMDSFEGEKSTQYEAFARELVETCIISDPWVEGHERFRLEPVVLSRKEHEAFCHAIESVGRAYAEMIGMLYNDSSLLDQSFYLTPWQRAMWIASGGAWHGIARADAFVLKDGSIRICELNADTPSGEPEAVILNEVRHPFHPNLINPNANFRDQFIGMVEASYRATFGEKVVARPTLGIVYPTDIPEDLSMIELYRRWFQEKGWNVVLGSPYNLKRGDDGNLKMFGERLHIVLRHYKTDWWGEREPVLYHDEEYLDPDPLDEPLQAILGADVDGRVAVVNPFGAILAQNKLAMAFFHKEIERFSSESREAIRAYIPPTFRLCDVNRDTILAEKERWVLKSDFGCEGDEVMIGKLSEQDHWERIVADAIPERWIVQEFFEAAADANEMIPNYGVFLIGGKAGGIFTRFSSASTDYRAVTAPTFVES